MFILKLWTKTSRSRRLNIKRVILFPVIVYTAYVLMDSFMPLLMVGFVVWLLYSWIGNRRS